MFHPYHIYSPSSLRNVKKGFFKDPGDISGYLVRVMGLDGESQWITAYDRPYSSNGDER